MKSSVKGRFARDGGFIERESDLDDLLEPRRSVRSLYRGQQRAISRRGLRNDMIEGQEAGRGWINIARDEVQGEIVLGGERGEQVSS